MLNFGHETEELEFKKSTSEMHDAMKDIVAILNKHEKGILYFGVAPNGDVKGLQVVESTLRDVSRVIFESIKPQIYPQIQKVTIDGCDIIEVKFSGRNKPYSAYGKYYIRVADESRELTPAELKEMMVASEYSEKWEQFETPYTIKDIDESALKDFYNRAIAFGRLPDDGYDAGTLLNKLGLLKNGNLNNAGYVLFGNNGPVTLKMAVFASDEKLTFLDINRTEDNIFRLVDTALTYIKRNIRWRAEIGNVTREEIPEIPLRALREIVINSFAHAEYGTGSQHEIDIHPGKVVIYNPGTFPSEFSPEDFATKNLSSIIRNELIAKVLYLCHDIESFGSGFKRVYTLCNAENVQVVAICDKYKERVEFASAKVVASGQKEPLKTTDYNDVIKAKADAVIVSTSWASHVEVALACMKAGIAVGIEVGGTHNINDCWKLVECYEQTKTPFMFLENCCFGKDEMLATSLVRNGVMGEVAYCQGYYCHDLREEITFQGLNANHYRLKEYSENNCDNYPTHNLGPIAKILNINAGNRFTKLVSMSSKAVGLKEYISQNAEKLSSLKDRNFAQGDVVTTMIECENGETIFLKLDTTLPRLYERGLTVSGTKGFYCQTTESVVLDDGRYNHETDQYKKAFFNQDDYKEYLPDEWRTITEEQRKAGHGGIDFIMLNRFFHCVENKLPMPVDVYDACSWMAVTALSAKSIAGGNIPVEFPDFTRGRYKTRKTVDVLDLPKVKR